MAQLSEVKVPDIGNYTNVPVIEVLVKPGDSVAKDQGLVTLESDKATMEVPSPVAGVIKELRVKLGDEVSEGVVVATIEAGDAAAAAAPAAPAKAEAPAKSEAAPKTEATSPAPVAAGVRGEGEAKATPGASAPSTPAADAARESCLASVLQSWSRDFGLARACLLLQASLPPP